MTDGEVTECTIPDLHRAWKRGDFILDVREPTEYAEAHVPSAVLIPLGEVGSRVAEVPEDHTVYVICRSGHRSITASRILARAGRRPISVSSGTLGWIAAGHPVATRPHGAEQVSR
ncbi:rhodanese-like domain-containing protein [Tessaracoccus sp. Z1128]